MLRAHLQNQGSSLTRAYAQVATVKIRDVPLAVDDTENYSSPKYPLPLAGGIGKATKFSCKRVLSQELVAETMQTVIDS